MLRWSFHILASISALLLIATAALWMRGHQIGDDLSVGYWDYKPHPQYPKFHDALQLDLAHSRGQVLIKIWRRQCVCNASVWRNGPGPGGRRWLLKSGPGDPASAGDWERVVRKDAMGMSFGRSANRYWSRDIALIPDWMLAAAFALLPTLWAIGYLRRRRIRQAGLCRGCGYDLRASSHRCPECGRPIDQPAVAAPPG